MVSDQQHMQTRNGAIVPSLPHPFMTPTLDITGTRHPLVNARAPIIDCGLRLAPSLVFIKMAWWHGLALFLLPFLLGGYRAWSASTLRLAIAIVFAMLRVYFSAEAMHQGTFSFFFLCSLKKGWGLSQNLRLIGPAWVVHTQRFEWIVDMSPIMWHDCAILPVSLQRSAFLLTFVGP